jgi:receptor protein-tyrosine kinase
MSVQSQRSLAERAVEALGGAGVLRGAPPGGGAPAAPPRGAAAPPESAAPPAPEPAHPPIARESLIAAGGVSLQGTRTRCAEEMAVIQQQVLRALKDIEPAPERCARLVLVTSARPAEGKTFTSLNLAVAVARHGGMGALLIDGDGKRGSLTSLLGCEGAQGLRDIAADPALDPARIVRPTEVARLRFMPSGVAPASATDPKTSPKALAEAFHRIAAAFPDDLLIVDAPPVLATSDASAAAALAGQVLVVVRAEATQRSEVEAALDMLDACPTLQLVLNRATASTPDSFGAYGYEAYAS